MKVSTIFSALIIPGLILIVSGDNARAFDVDTFVSNFENRNDQTAFVGQIDSLTIIRGNFEFHLGQGELTVLDFGGGMPCAMVFDGPVRFRYSPPDEIERYQLERLYDRSAIEDTLDNLTLFYTINLTDFPDTSRFKRKRVSNQVWRRLAKAQDYAFDYFSEYMPNKLLNDILSNQTGTYFYADIWISRYNHLVFIEDHRFDDVYRLYKPRLEGGLKTYDVLAGHSPDNSRKALRELNPIDVTHYEIESKIDRGGDMTVNCKIHFKPLDDARKFLYWNWYEQNEPLAALDINGDTLKIINNHEEWGFGVVLNSPLVKDRDEYIEINFDCKAVRNIFGNFVVEGQTYWYPLAIPWDRATYDLRYECLDDYEVISCGTRVESSKRDGLLSSRWLVDIPVKYVSFNIGVFDKMEFTSDGGPPVIIYQGENFRHNEIPEYYAARYDNISSANMFDLVGRDVSKSLSYFSNTLGPCLFDTIRVSEIPMGFGQGSPGLLHLSWYTFQFDDLIGTEERFRAHEVSHQWFGHVVEYGHYGDTWINEGMAEYLGYMYYESIAPDREPLKAILKNWRRDIILGSDRRVISTDKRLNGINNYKVVVSDGSSAGPMVLGSRLDNSISYDYQHIVYTKAAYVYHMIRYLLHDYETDSDEAFIAFIRDLLDKYNDKPITTEGLRALLNEHLNDFDINADKLFDQYVYGMDIPEYEFSYDTEPAANDKYRVICHVNQNDVPAGFKVAMPVTIHFENNLQTTLVITIDQPLQDIKLPDLPFEPKKIDFNAHGAVLCRVKYK
ncbi:MAG: M1 family metallopeptidase [candidate division Zixibacteria bacterium]|nr:M1 family metallopeptidase [candidate division Zixibacteria bacterium]